MITAYIYLKIGALHTRAAQPAIPADAATRRQDRVDFGTRNSNNVISIYGAAQLNGMPLGADTRQPFVNGGSRAEPLAVCSNRSISARAGQRSPVFGPLITPNSRAISAWVR